jgi:hypothetical protein
MHRLCFLKEITGNGLMGKFDLHEEFEIFSLGYCNLVSSIKILKSSHTGLYKGKIFLKSILLKKYSLDLNQFQKHNEANSENEQERRLNFYFDEDRIEMYNLKCDDNESANRVAFTLIILFIKSFTRILEFLKYVPRLQPFKIIKCQLPVSILMEYEDGGQRFEIFIDINDQSLYDHVNVKQHSSHHTFLKLNLINYQNFKTDVYEQCLASLNGENFNIYNFLAGMRGLFLRKYEKGTAMQGGSDVNQEENSAITEFDWLSNAFF